MVLVPSPRERDVLEERGLRDHSLHLCGVGPVAAAARTMRLLQTLRPRQVLLLGIAGSFDLQRFPLGSARRFSAARMDGIGVRHGASVRSLHAGRLPPHREDDSEEFGDELQWEEGDSLILTVPDASDSPAAKRRRTEHPDALAEDMESYAVAFACRCMETPLAVVRGASNLVGERDHLLWCIDEALKSAAEFALHHMVRKP
ncbi:MAG TPA: hypothetical protein PKA37_06875 [Planctomycetota bacterium]|nr:hypothetical protein [Planctomycetota bacterium]